MLRLGSKDELDLDEDGQIKDDEKWDYKTNLEQLEIKIGVGLVKPIYNFNSEIKEYINRSFLEGPKNFLSP